MQGLMQTARALTKENATPKGTAAIKRPAQGAPAGQPEGMKGKQGRLGTRKRCVPCGWQALDDADGEAGLTEQRAQVEVHSLQARPRSLRTGHGSTRQWRSVWVHGSGWLPSCQLPAQTFLSHTFFSLDLPYEVTFSPVPHHFIPSGFHEPLGEESGNCHPRWELQYQDRDCHRYNQESVNIRLIQVHGVCIEGVHGARSAQGAHVGWPNASQL